MTFLLKEAKSRRYLSDRKQMQISTNLNRYYHSLLADFWKQATARRLNINGFEKFKDGVKELNSEYPRAGGKTISTTKISPKDLCRHIEFIKDFASYYGFELAIVEAEWERIKQMAR